MRESALAVSLRGDMPQPTLERFRELLGMSRRGRLTDAEDAHFGMRHLEDARPSDADLDLWRHDDGLWVVRLTYEGSAPPADVLERCKAEITAAAKQLGLDVEQVREWHEDGREA
jgi:hypothetical protein